MMKKINTHFNRLNVWLRHTMLIVMTILTVLSQELYAQPANDECSNALGLSINPDLNCNSFASGTLLGATASSEPDACGGTFDDDVWYSFVATSTYHQIIVSNISGSTTDLVYQLSEGSCGNITELQCHDDPDAGFNTVPLTIGNSYYLRVASYSSSPQTTTFDICIGTLPPPTGNYNCSNATMLTVYPDLNCTTSTSGALSNAYPSGEPESCNGNFDDDLWYSFVATSNYHEIIVSNISGSTQDLVYQLSEGSCGNITELQCHDDPDAGFNTVPLTIGNSYYLRVATWSQSPQTTTFDICIGTPPPPTGNYNCSNATMLTVYPDLNCTTSTSGALSNAYPSGEPESCDGTFDDDLWYSFVATSTYHQIIVSNISGSTTNLVYQLSEGNCCNLTELQCHDDPNAGFITVALTIGNTYSLRVATWSQSPQTTTFDICIGTPLPTNDDCSNAIALTINAYNTFTFFESGTTVRATASPETLSCIDYGMEFTENFDDDVWYSFIATDPVHMIFINNTSVPMINQLSEGACGNITEIDCSPYSPITSTTFVPGTTYYVRVATDNFPTPLSGTFDICITLGPPAIMNDDCSSAVALTVNSDMSCTTFSTATLFGATPSVEASCFSNTFNDIWYSFVATESRHTIQSSNNFTSVNGIQVSEGTCGNITEIDCFMYHQDIFIINGLTIGNTYFVRLVVDPFYFSPPFEICIGTTPSAPINDECSNATMLTVNPGIDCSSYTTGTIEWASPSSEPTSCMSDFDDDGWYSFVATDTTHFVGVDGDGIDAQDLVVQLSEGTCGNLTELQCHDDVYQGFLANSLVAGNTYYLRVASYGSAIFTTTFDICITTPITPPNDECINAIPLTINPDATCAIRTAGSTIGATNSPDEGIGQPAGPRDNDVWYSFVTTSSNDLLVGILNNSSPLLMDFYLGDNGCGSNLVFLATCPTHTQELSVPEAGIIVYIRVYGQLGTFDMCVAEDIQPGPVNEECINAETIQVSPNPNCSDAVTGTTFRANISDLTVFYSFTGTDYPIVIETSNYDGQIIASGYTPTGTDIDIYTGSCGGGLTLVASGPSPLDFTPVVGVSYYLTVKTSGIHWGEFDLCLYRPYHDDDNDGLLSDDDLCPYNRNTSLSFEDSGDDAGNTSDYIEIPHDAAFTLTEGDFALEAWVYPTNGDHKTIITKGDGLYLSNYIFGIWADGTAPAPGKAGLWLVDKNNVNVGQWLFSNSSIVQNQWTHIAVSVDNSGLYPIASFYVNGIADGSASYSIPSANLYDTDTNPLFIGKQGYSLNSHFFDGKMDELAIWDKTVTEADMTASMQTPYIGIEQGLVAYYNFNEGTACGSNTSLNTLKQINGSHDGTLIGFSKNVGACSSNWVSGRNMGDCHPDICLDDLVLTGPWIQDKAYSAADHIESTHMISGSSVVEYDAGIDIELEPGFEVEAGTTFLAYIDGCDYTSYAELINAGGRIQDLLDEGVSPADLIGVTVGGGIIFYVDATSGYTLIAAPTDQATADWGCYCMDVTGAEGVAIGTGNQNTLDIVQSPCSAADKAANVCSNLVLNGYSDWFLPSEMELKEMYLNIGPGAAAPNTNIGNFTKVFYRSSTEVNINDSYYLNFNDGSDLPYDKTSTHPDDATRAIRAIY